MSIETLELVSTAAIEKLENVKFNGQMDLHHAYSGLKTAAEEYKSRNWTKSAELFINIWRYSRDSSL